MREDRGGKGESETVNRNTRRKIIRWGEERHKKKENQQECGMWW